MNAYINSFAKRVAAIAALAVVIGACAATPHSRSTGQYIDDAALTAHVKSALTESPETKARDIDVDVYKGVVQLSGFVDDAYEKAQAEWIARQVDGVKEVQNHLSIR